MTFIPQTKPDQVIDVPYFDDVTADAGWQGHSTSKTIDTLKSEIVTVIARLGGIVTAFQRGTFHTGEHQREGFRIHYAIEAPDGTLMAGRMDIAALPVKDEPRLSRSLDVRRDKSLRMALYMLRNALEGTWFLQQLSPGYAPLMPWMIAGDTDKTVTQLWSETTATRQLLPGSADDFRRD